MSQVFKVLRSEKQQDELINDDEGYLSKPSSSKKGTAEPSRLDSRRTVENLLKPPKIDPDTERRARPREQAINEHEQKLRSNIQRRKEGKQQAQAVTEPAKEKEKQSIRNRYSATVEDDPDNDNS